MMAALCTIQKLQKMGKKCDIFSAVCGRKVRQIMGEYSGAFAVEKSFSLYLHYSMFCSKDIRAYVVIKPPANTQFLDHMFYGQGTPNFGCIFSNFQIWVTSENVAKCDWLVFFFLFLRFVTSVWTLTLAMTKTLIRRGWIKKCSKIASVCWPKFSKCGVI